MEKKRIIIVSLIIIAFIICIIVSFISYKDKYVISFETGTNETILNQYIEKDNKVIEPKSPSKEGYIFVEWQLNGEKYDFNTNVEEDIILTAKWIKEEYIIVSYETDSTYSIEPTKMLKGSVISNLPVAYKDGYEFVGWSINGKLYNNEVINDDVVLTAEYEIKKLEPEYKVGDIVLITGSYSNNAYSIGAYYNVAIGWYREIIKIINDSNYPYAVGENGIITGYFKANSLEKIN